MSMQTQAPSRCSLCHADGRAKKLYRVEGFEIMRCPRCGLVFIVDDQAPDQLADLYSGDYYETRHTYYFENAVANPGAGVDNANLDEFRDALRMLGELNGGRGRLLDVGCAIGIFLAIAQNAGWQVAGVDVSEYAVRRAREMFSVDARHGALDQAGFPDGHFDVVTMWDVIEHVEDPVALLRDAARVLKPGGLLLVNTPNEAALLKVLARCCYAGSFGSVRYPVRKLYHRYHRVYLTARTLNMALERAGFEPARTIRTTIPVVKARGSRIEKAVVHLLSYLERILKREYQLTVIARKA